MASVLNDLSVPVALPPSPAEAAGEAVRNASPPQLTARLAADRELREALDDMRETVGALDSITGLIGLALLAVVLAGWLLG